MYQKGKLNLERRSDEGGKFDIQVIPAGQLHVCEIVGVFVLKESLLGLNAAAGGGRGKSCRQLERVAGE